MDPRDPPQSPWPSLDELAGERYRSRRRPPLILVAEDDEEMRSLLVQALAGDGYVVRAVADGARLVEQVSEQPLAGGVDLIIADIRLPVVDGLAAVEALRRARCTVPVILVTAFGDDATRRKALTLGAMLFDKPFALADLRTAVMYLVPIR